MNRSESPFYGIHPAGQGSSRTRGLAETSDRGSPRRQREEAVPGGAVQMPGLPRRRPGRHVPDDGGMADPLDRVGRRRHGNAARRVLGARPAAQAVPGRHRILAAVSLHNFIRIPGTNA
jgi:hypothetical protein